jgi:hypothetical protein
MIKRALVTVCCLSLVLALPAVAGSKTVSFTSLHGRISCQVSSGGAFGTSAYCQSTKPASSVMLHKTGAVRICKGVACLGNAPENATTIKAGKDVVVGPFDCYTDQHHTVTCFVTKSGKGFEVTSTQIKKVTIRQAATL